MMTHGCDVGAFVKRALMSPRVLVRHDAVLDRYATDAHEERREAYLSHFAYGAEMRTHYEQNFQSVAGFTGPCTARWLVFDIDRDDLGLALADARRLAAFVRHRYGDDPPAFFSGGKGFHVLVNLANDPPPSADFPRIARAFAETLADAASVTIDTSIYDVNRIVRLPNTNHPRTGLFKRRIDVDALLRLDVAGIKELAREPSGESLRPWGSCPPILANDWADAERLARSAANARQTFRRDEGTPIRAPGYFLDFLRGNVEEHKRARVLFQCAAFIFEVGDLASLAYVLLTDPARDVGLPPAEVNRQIRCGIEHARKQQEVAASAEPVNAEINEPNKSEGGSV